MATRVSRTRQCASIPTLAVIRERSNTATSSYHSLQTSLQKRLRAGFAAEVHYTWSKFLDTASEIFNPSSGEVAVPQDSFDIGADKAVSTYDRPHRFTGNFVYELPFFREQDSLHRQVPRRLAGELGVHVPERRAVHGAQRIGPDRRPGRHRRPGRQRHPSERSTPTMELSNMTIPDIIAAGGASLFRTLCGNPTATCAGERVGNVGRNTLRADGIQNIDLGFIKNTRFGRTNLQFRVEMFNATNTRNFGIPEGRVYVDQLPEPVGHRWRQAHHLGLRAVHVLSPRLTWVEDVVGESAQGSGLRAQCSLSLEP